MVMKMKMRFRYGLVGNLIFFGGTAACLGYFGYLLMSSSNSKIQKEAIQEIINKNNRVSKINVAKPGNDLREDGKNKGGRGVAEEDREIYM